MVGINSIEEMPPWYFWASLDFLGVTREESQGQVQVSPERRAAIDARIRDAITTLREAVPPGLDAAMPDERPVFRRLQVN